MKFLVIGLGSMGKRRIRNLIANNQNNLAAFDIREDRINEAHEKYGIKTYNDFEEALRIFKPDTFIISVPPDQHMYYMNYAIDNNIHCFIEASVVDGGMEEILEKSKKNKDIKICPSCTLRFHPSIKLIKNLLDEKAIGKISHFTYHSGQYLPDWHPWEDIKEFYVSNKETGGCREIVPFELTWLNWIFGNIKSICGFKDKTINLGVDIDDVYSLNVKYGNGVLGSLVVDVVSRFAIRNLVINGDKGQIQWNWNEKCLKLYDACESRWIIYEEPKGSAAEGYNVNIIEDMYIDEIKSFIDCVEGKGEFLNSLEEDYTILQYLYGLEKADESKSYIEY
ncbi:Gfo/Idh/MocA family protein [Crassaminicella profunda]|uniref:Gfo/Idh/MocA family protein n=1 Tax=Crassaminicella profunda TaxID=1286698 RepID=UPI001CA70C7A|nr:Gfo/Idh/MocA family oxidoreductase [Crassaminicella profunda]QZY54305.1 Gfo/Idh/MocA family oxidoreductase [Crassaminicella profunda]